MPTIRGPVGRLQVDDGGSGGVPVVFVHSYAGSISHWSRSLAHLRRHRQAVAFDLRGHGASDPPSSGDYAISALADDLAAVVDQLDLDRFVLVGHSTGGSVAIAYAATHPARVAGLVLVATPGRAPDGTAEQIAEGLKADYDGVTAKYFDQLLTGSRPSVEARIRSDIAAMSPEATTAITVAGLAYDPVADLRRIDAPVLLVDSAHADGPTALHRQLPDLRYVVAQNTGHWLQLDLPERFMAILDAFVAAQPTSSMSDRTASASSRT
jgi:pimeloyl-ACP methyl ester carboxylesterase